MMEIMLSGNFKKEYVVNIKNKIEEMSNKYRELFKKSSLHLEEMSNSAIEANVLKSIGIAGNTFGKIVGNIPLVKEGPVDEFLQDSGLKLKRNALNMEKEIIKEFALISNPETGGFVKKIDEIIHIYNYTEDIYFDNEKIYLVEK